MENTFSTINLEDPTMVNGTDVSLYATNTTFETIDANSNYNAFQTTYEHQPGMGLTVLANYSYGRCMNDQRTQAKTSPSYRTPWLSGFADEPGDKARLSLLIWPFQLNSFIVKASAEANFPL
jgi:hypothetical protein